MSEKFLPNPTASRTANDVKDNKAIGEKIGDLIADGKETDELLDAQNQLLSLIVARQRARPDPIQDLLMGALLQLRKRKDQKG